MSQTQAKYVQEGCNIDYTPSSAVTAGDVIELGSRALIAPKDIAADALGALSVEGVWDVPKASGAMSAGDEIYWDNDGNPNVGSAGSGAATKTSSGNTFLGLCVADAASGDTYVRVKQDDSGASATSVPTFSPNAVAAAGSSNSDATAIGATDSFVLATGADGTKGIKLPAAAAGKIVIIKNRDSENAILKVYPSTGDGINALTVTTGALSMAAKTSAIFVAYDATTWYTIPLLPS